MGGDRRLHAPPLIRAIFGKSEEIDDGTSVQDVSSSIFCGAECRLEQAARGDD